MRESKIEKYLHDQVVKLGGTTRKWVCPGRRGVPDRIILWPSNVTRCGQRVDFVETKTARGKLSTAQIREHERLRAFGFGVFVIRSTDEVDFYVS